MSIPYILEEKSVIRKENSSKTITEVISDAKGWIEELQEATSLDNKYFYANVFDSESKKKFFVYSDKGAEYFDLTSFTIEFGEVYNNAIIVGNGIDNPGYILNSEVLTEIRWTDDKPIYRKVIPFNIPLNELTTILVDDDIESIIKMEYHTTNNGIKVVFSGFHSSADTNYAGVWFDSADGNKLTVKAMVDFYADIDSFIIFEYTKKSDTSVSPVALINPDIFDTNETITNKIWMGKPIFRRVLSYSQTLKNEEALIPFENWDSDIVDTMVTIYDNNMIDNTTWYIDDKNRFNFKMTKKGVYVWHFIGDYEKTYTGTVVLEYTKQ